MLNTKPNDTSIEGLDVSLERDGFLRSLIRELSGLLEDVVGLDEAAGFISVVGQNIGDQINSEYKQALQISQLDREQITMVLQDLKHRIQGDFYVIDVDKHKVIFGNRVCPFADKVKDRPSLCMMTSNVFGTIAAENNGYAKVALEETIAQGNGGCRVVVYFEDTDEARDAEGREYYQTGK